MRVRGDQSAAPAFVEWHPDPENSNVPPDRAQSAAVVPDQKLGVEADVDTHGPRKDASAETGLLADQMPPITPANEIRDSQSTYFALVGARRLYQVPRLAERGQSRPIERGRSGERCVLLLRRCGVGSIASEQPRGQLARVSRRLHTAAE